MRYAYKSIDTEQNTSETWGFDLYFLRGFISRIWASQIGKYIHTSLFIFI